MGLAMGNSTTSQYNVIVDTAANNTHWQIIFFNIYTTTYITVAKLKIPEILLQLLIIVIS